MKYSFLIPSKNRLALLKRAVDSIRGQKAADYEIIVADNASQEDYQAYVDSMAGGRLVYTRTAVPVSVTENWNNALDRATGDYVLMLGDDDALAPWFCRVVENVLSHGNAPDIVYLAAYHYCYPNVMPGQPRGYLADLRNSRFFEGRTRPFRLTPEEATAVAKAAFDFRYWFGFNSQHFLFRASFLDQLRSLGGVFQSPYPDTFAAVVSFLKARAIDVIPEPAVLIGISPKSFGYYYFNDRSAEGYEFLQNEQVAAEVRQRLQDVVLPGDRNNTNWLVAVEMARRTLRSEYDLHVNVDRYRLLQIASFLRDIYLKSVRSPDESSEFKKRLTSPEQAVFVGMQAAIEAASLVGPAAASKAWQAIEKELAQFYPAKVRMLDIGRHASIADACSWLRRQMPSVVGDAA